MSEALSLRDEQMHYDAMEQALAANRHAAQLLAERAGMYEVHAQALEQFLGDDTCEDEDVLLGSLMIVRPLLEEKLKGNIKTSEEKAYGAPHEMLNALLKDRLGAEDRKELCSFDQNLQYMRTEFGADIEETEIAWLQYMGLMTLAEAEPSINYTATGDRETGAAKRLELVTNEELDQPPTDEDVAEYILSGNTLPPEVLQNLPDRQIRRVLSSVAGAHELQDTEVENRFRQLNGLITPLSFRYEHSYSPLEEALGAFRPPEAKCRNANPEIFYPEQGGSTKEAKRICEECPIRIPCLDYALENNERFGVWGGFSERERRKIQQRQKR